MHESIVIERAELGKLSDADYSIISTLVMQLTNAEFVQDCRPVLDATLSQQCIHMYIARDKAAGGAIRGMASLVYFRCVSGSRGRVEDVVVDQAARGQGLGEALTMQLVQTAEALGVQTLDLTSHPSRIAANNLYKKLGFVQRDTNMYRLLLPRK